ncbi:hypothetical protein, partial [Candidatus Frankia alpina]|uniref:hypothetical protein n=1 Tax=Candidatus Frankia alpina TaxID=2699483 RepID=UPI001A99460F
METFWTALESSTADLRIAAITEGIGLVWRRVAARVERWDGTWRPVRLSAAADLLQIIRSVPCRPDSGIGFPDVATMKAWKK